MPYGRWVTELLLPFPRAGVFRSIVLYTIICEIRVSKLELFLRVGRATGKRYFFGLNTSKNGWQKVVVLFCLPWAAGRIRNKIN